MTKKSTSEELQTKLGEPGAVDRFRFEAVKSGVGFRIQMSRGLQNDGTPLFEDDAGWIGFGDYSPFPTRLAALKSKAEALTFVLETQSQGVVEPPFALHLKFSPDHYLSADAHGQVFFAESTQANVDPLIYAFDIEAAPQKYEMVVSVDNVDFSQSGFDDKMVVEEAIAAQRKIHSEREGTTFTIELSSVEEESKTLITSTEQLFRKFVTGSMTFSQEISVQAGVNGKFLGCGFDSSVTSTTQYSATMEAGVDYQTTMSASKEVTEMRSVTISDSLENSTEPDSKLLAELMVVRRKATDITTFATAQLFADGILVATSRFDVSIDSVTISSGQITVTEME